MTTHNKFDSSKFFSTSNIFRQASKREANKMHFLVDQKKGPYVRIIDIINGKADGLIEDIFLDKIELQTRIHVADNKQSDTGLCCCH